MEGIAPVPVEGATGAAEHSVLVQDNIDQEWNEVAAAVEVLHAAGRALVVLCSAVDRYADTWLQCCPVRGIDHL